MHRFDAAYPFAIVNLEDDEMPVSAKAKTFNPFIPGDEIIAVVSRSLLSAMNKK
jgi:hypothetical protein